MMIIRKTADDDVTLWLCYLPSSKNESDAECSFLGEWGAAEEK